MDFTPILTAIIGGLIVYVGNIAVNRAKARRDSAEANAIDVETFRKLVDDVKVLNEKVNNLEKKNSALWQYLLGLLEQMRRLKIRPIDPPRELDSDPEIMKILEEINAEATK